MTSSEQPLSHNLPLHNPALGSPPLQPSPEPRPPTGQCRVGSGVLALLLAAGLLGFQPCLQRVPTLGGRGCGRFTLRVGSGQEAWTDIPGDSGRAALDLRHPVRDRGNSVVRADRRQRFSPPHALAHYPFRELDRLIHRRNHGLTVRHSWIS